MTAENASSAERIAAADRILVVGVSGTGKSRIARELGKLRGLPIVHLDPIFFLDDWVERADDEVEQLIREAIEAPRWIIEGYVDPLSQERIERAEVIIDLAFSGFSALRGGIDRWRTTRGRAREEMPASNIEDLAIGFWWIQFLRKERPEIDVALAGTSTPIITLRNRRAVGRLLKSLTMEASE